MTLVRFSQLSLSQINRSYAISPCFTARTWPIRAYEKVLFVKAESFFMGGAYI